MANTHHISDGSGSVEVYSDYARELEDNGLQADARCTLKIAPQVNAKCEILYMTTNADDVLIGWVDDDGRYQQSDSVAEWIDAPDCDWLREAIDEFQGHSTKSTWQVLWAATHIGGTYGDGDFLAQSWEDAGFTVGSDGQPTHDPNHNTVARSTSTPFDPNDPDHVKLAEQNAECS